MPLPVGPAVVTGGSSGIGFAVAARLAGFGHPVALIARRVDQLDAAAKQIRKSHSDARLQIVSADVTDATALGRAFDTVRSVFGPPRTLICAAGVSAPGLFEEVGSDVHRWTMEVNYFGTLNAVQAIRPDLAPGARIGLISSAVALGGIYGYSAYAPSKFAVRGLAEVLRVELAEQEVGVTLCLPPDTDTPQLAAELPLRPAATNRIAAMGDVLSAEEVARALLAGMAANRFMVLPGTSLKALHLFGGMIGAPMRWMQRRIIRRTNR